jgi:alpha-1,6-mannosyltransferase
LELGASLDVAIWRPEILKICDLTQFYSPLSGGVKRYVHEKIDFIQEHSPQDKHVLIVPGAKTKKITNKKSEVYLIHSPLLSRSSRYRALLNLRAISEIMERERPDIIESSDPYQIAWKSLQIGKTLGIPVVAFYHSHFTEAYVRGTAKFLGRSASEAAVKAARAYVRELYNRFEATLVPSEPLAALLAEWGVRNVRTVQLGVNTDVFNPDSDDGAETRQSLGIPPKQQLLLYVGRLSKDKNTACLLRAFEILEKRRPREFHLLVIGDGAERNLLSEIKRHWPNVTWIKYCTDSLELARYYRAADLFVHPGVQETFGLVALESQASGTPVVGIKGTYMDRVILHDQEGWATENTPEALAAAIETVNGRTKATPTVDISLMAAEAYAWPSVFARQFCIYRDVCARYGKN